MTQFILVVDGVVIQRQPYTGFSFVEAPDDVFCGMLFDGEVYSYPPPIVLPPPPLSLTDEASTLLTIVDGEVYETQRAKGIAGAFSFGGTAYVYYDVMFDDDTYIAICNAPVVKFQDRAEISLAGFEVVKLIVQQIG